ncbi:hypothetical protein [Micromonospora sp. NBC_00858]|uniref:hypothetical protein n=1 Tax=Micromonospora sp. NBC_00858 TaxID=2975979 RepID=UPI00386AB439|nr:hypothetical protein OG990_06560 [Micromonospora sp. NBC_00858]
MRRDLRVIRDELHCDAVRITGGVQDRLELTARFAVEAGLEVWYSPFTDGLDRDGLMAFVLDGAERAERLRQIGASVVYLTGSEIAMVTDGFLPGRDLAERMALFTELMRIREAVPAARAAVRDFLAEAVPTVRERFAGPVGYRVAGQCSALQGGGGDPRWEGAKPEQCSKPDGSAARCTDVRH